MFWKAQKWKKKSGDMFKRFNFLVFPTSINNFLGLVNQHDKNVTTVFNSSSNP